MSQALSKLRALIQKKRDQFGSLVALSIASGIPLRTLEDWAAGRREPREYVISGIIQQLEKAEAPTGAK